MLAAYIVAAIVGGGMIVFSALAGLGAHGDISHDLGTDASHDVSHDASHDSGDGHHHVDDGAGAFWLLFFSLRFWIYAVGAFGTLGVVLTVTRALAEPMTLTVSAIGGLLMGLFTAGTVRWLTRSELQSTVSTVDFQGALARVTVAIGEGQPGKVRTTVKGDIIDLMAIGLDGGAIPRETEVVIVDMQGDKAVVAPSTEILKELTSHA